MLNSEHRSGKNCTNFNLVCQYSIVSFITKKSAIIAIKKIEREGSDE